MQTHSKAVERMLGREIVDGSLGMSILCVRAHAQRSAADWLSAHGEHSARMRAARIDGHVAKQRQPRVLSAGVRMRWRREHHRRGRSSRARRRDADAAAARHDEPFLQPQPDERTTSRRSSESPIVGPSDDLRWVLRGRKGQIDRVASATAIERQCTRIAARLDRKRQ